MFASEHPSIAGEDLIMQKSGLTAGPGIGFKSEHFQDLKDGQPDLAFIEIHAENYMGAGGVPFAMLDRLRTHYALSVHGVGLSIGGEKPLDDAHLKRVKAVCDRFEPASFSEHLAWSTHDNQFLNDLLPLPYTRQTLDRVCAHIDHLQTSLKRQVLLENPATYLTFLESTMSEVDFIRAIAMRTGCGLLLDINNVYISAHNHGFLASHYLAEFPLNFVREIHLAGHDSDHQDHCHLLIDTHDCAVDGAVWDLFDATLAQTGPIATLIEWDQNIPPFSVLYAEAKRASHHLAQCALFKVAS